MSKKIVMVLIILALVLTQVGCNQSQTQDERPIRVAMIPKIIDISYFDKCAEGAIEVASKYHMEVVYKGPTTADAAAQVNIIQDMIYNNVDVIVIAPIDPEAVRPILTEARNKGIIVVTYDADATMDSRDIFVNQVSAEVLGTHIMDNMAEMIGNDGQYAIITASLTADNQNTWIDWIKLRNETMYEGIELVSVVPTDESQQKAYANTRNIIQAYPELDGILALSTESGPAAASAVEALALKEDIELYALALPNDMKVHIQSGSADLVTLWDPYQLGALTMEVVNKLVNDEKLFDGMELGDFEDLFYIEEEGVVIMGEPLDFDASNIDDYDF